MNNLLKGSISSLMDDAGTELDIHQVLSDSPNNDKAIKIWSRYQLISATLQKKLPQNFRV